jgi:hypothetical protein
LCTDEAKDHTSLDRALVEKLYMIVKSGGSWGFPEGDKLEDMTMRDSALQLVLDKLGEGTDVTVYPVGNAPIHHLLQPFEEAKRADSFGQAVYFYKSQYVEGAYEPKEDQLWVTKAELAGYVDADYYDAVKDMLPEF